MDGIPPATASLHDRARQQRQLHCEAFPPQYTPRYGPCRLYIGDIRSRTDTRARVATRCVEPNAYDGAVHMVGRVQANPNGAFLSSDLQVDLPVPFRYMYNIRVSHRGINSV